MLWYWQAGGKRSYGRWVEEKNESFYESEQLLVCAKEPWCMLYLAEDEKLKIQVHGFSLLEKLEVNNEIYIESLIFINSKPDIPVKRN